MQHSYIKITVLALSFSTTSCYTVRQSYVGNSHLQQLGQSSSSIMANYGPPDRTTSDGSSGQILIYEQIAQVSYTNASASSYSRYGTNSAALYGNGAAVGASRTAGAQYSTGNAFTQTSEIKAYKQFFVNNQNVVYFVRTNTGDQYSYSKCLSPGKTWALAGCGILYWPTLFVTVPVAAIVNAKAKKNGTTCK